MPNSSRRKQSKPQHLPSEEEEGGARNEMNQTVTSSCPADGVKNTQEDIYGSKVTGLILRENGDSNTENIPVVLEKDHDTSKTNGGDSVGITNISDKDSLPHDLSVKTKVTGNDKDLDLEDQSSGEGLVQLYSPPSSQESTKHFKSKYSLHYHQRMSQGKDTADDNTALRYQYFQKSQKEDSFSPSPNITPTDTGNALHLESSTLQQDPPAKRQRLDDALPLQTLYNSAIVPGSADSGYDLRVPKTTESAPKGLLDENAVDSQDFTRACPVCTKVFPKPSDLKRHMMCHTGEKPFRCEFCNKPFRAKSSMHYHLKAAHGVGIELSPGLEERYLRNKARSQMNMVQRNHFTDATLYHRDNQIDIDDIDEDSESVDSSHFPNSGIGSEITDTKSQGHFVNTGNEAKSALDLSISGRSKEEPVGYRAGQLSENIIRTESLFKKSKISIQNETILVTRLDGLDIVNGQSTSIYKCHLCGKMFHLLSKLQCHLSLHFEKHLVTYECCFCEDVFQFKVQLRNHIQRRHSAQLNKSSGKDDQGNSTSNIQSATQNQCDNQYTCRYCQKVFTKQISFNKHMRLHFWNRNCFCRICGKSFIHYTSLQLHMSRFHWKTIGKSSKSSPLRRKINFFNTYRFKPESHDGIPDSNEPLDLIKAKPHTESRPVNGSMTLMLPKSPLVNGDHSDTGMSLHSSENNWSSNMSSDMYETEDGAEIMSAPKRSLIPFKGDQSPRHKFLRKSTQNHLKNQTQLTSDNNVPLNFIKSEPSHQDSNNNESVQNKTLPAPESKGLSTGPESLMSGYSMNATNHLLMAKALAAHQTLSHLTNTSQPMIFPPNHLPPSLAAMTQMMTLPVSVPALNSEAVISTSQSPSPASHTSSKSDTSPDDRDNTKETGVRDPMASYPRVQWSHFMYSPSSDTGHTDGRKVSSLSRTHSRLGIVHTPINREAVCKPTVLADGRTVYKCPFCTKEFVSFSDINRHMDFHEDIRPYKCQYCDYYARTNSQLKVHMMRHQGIREYCCKLCNYKGVTQSDLNRHMKSQIHMLKARNACTYCGEGFVTTKNLEKHLDGNCIVKMQKLNGGLDLPLQESIA